VAHQHNSSAKDGGLYAHALNPTLDAERCDSWRDRGLLVHYPFVPRDSRLRRHLGQNALDEGLHRQDADTSVPQGGAPLDDRLAAFFGRDPR